VTRGPQALIAELTHACPLKCLYCSNPLQLAARENELSEEDWLKVIHQAAGLGMAQVSFTGGEPCLRADLPALVRAARQHGLYVNLITSGVGVSEKALQNLVAAGVDHIQLSFQDTDRAAAQQICGVDALAKKKQVAAWIAELPVAFTVNLVIHRTNHARLEEMIEMAAAMKATKIEVAHVQFNGWALKNRAHLMPDGRQVRDSMRIIEKAKEKWRGQVRLDYVLPDYFAQTPKPCMGGWATKMLLVNPLGLAAPCHSAETIPGFKRPSVREQTLREIWFDSELFQAFRGEEWMLEPCRSCEKKLIDFGGCRCQALALTGDARAADPVCHKSGHRHVIDEVLSGQSLESASPPAYRS